MAQRVYSSQKMLEEKTAQAAASGSFTKAEFVNLKPDPATDETVRHLRIIGCPIRFRQFTDKKRKEGGEKGATVKVPFPDAHLNSNYTRIGTENDPAYGECPWAKMGYIGSWRYAVNVLERQKDGTSVVKILEKGGSIFNKIMDFETNNREYNSENPDDAPLCVMLGGLVAHDIKIKAKANAQALGGVEYIVSVNPKPNKVTDEEIELLRAIGVPKDDEIALERKRYEQDRKDDPQLPEWADWYLFGHNVSQIFKPTLLKTESSSSSAPVAAVEATDSDDLVIDDVPEPVVTKPAAKTATKASKAAPVAEMPNPFDDEEVDTSDAESPDWE